LWAYELQGFEGRIGVPKCRRPLNSTEAGLLNQQQLKIAHMEVELETFAEEEEE
jgi:hypothetical protein